MKSFIAAFDLHFGWEYRYERGRRFMAPTHSLESVAALMAFARDFKPDVFILGGDQLNCGPVSHWLKGKPRLVENFRLKDEMDLLNKHILLPIDTLGIKRKVWHDGNHDCFQQDTEILGEHGWVDYKNAYECRKVWSVNPATGKAELVPVTDIVMRKVENQSILTFENSRMSIAVTPEHRMFTMSSGGNWKFDLAKDVGKARNIRSAAETTSPEYPMSDEEIRLTAWLLTDSSITERGYVTFHQREQTSYRIREVLTALGLAFSEYRRVRNTTHICGKKLKHISPSIDFKVLATDSRKITELISGNKNHIPTWAWHLSARQLRLFIEELIFTDGTRYNGDRSNVVMFYCDRHELRGQFLGLCALAGITATERAYASGKHWRVNLSLDKQVRDLVDYTESKFTGVVWCLSNKNGTLFTKRKGSISVAGNCWIEQLLDETPGLEGIVEPRNYLGLLERGYEIYSQGEISRLGKLNFVHGDVLSPGKYRAARLVQLYRRNIRCGHFHSFEAATDVTPYDRSDFHTGIVVPAMARCNGAYMKNGVTNHHQGFLYGWVADNGNFTDHVMTIVNNKFIHNGKVYDGRSKGK